MTTRDGKLQCEIISALAAHIPGFQTHRWRDCVVEAFVSTEHVEGLEDDFSSYVRDFNYVPDGFVIDREEMRLDLFEVEVTSPLTRTKLQAYGALTTVLDYYGIEFTLFAVNQHGHINEVPLLHHYIDWLAANREEAAST